MRQIGTLGNEEHGQSFADYLTTKQIASTVEPNSAGEWIVWIHDEDAVASGKDELERFRANPNDSTYADAQKEAKKVRAAEERANKQAQKNVVDVRQQWAQTSSNSMPVTKFLVFVSVVIGVMTGFGEEKEPVISKLTLAEIRVVGDSYVFRPYLADIRDGQVWRLFTTMFVHHSMLHLFFNMWMTWYLGGMVESRRGWLRFLALVLLYQVTSNLGSYFFENSVAHGGMSGVLYGLFGYIWMKTRFDLAAGFYLPSSTVFIMLFWFLACFTGAFGPIANGAHAVGLVLGIATGYLPIWWRQNRKQR